MNHTQAWTPDESDILIRMDKDGATNAEIADALPGRSARQVRRRREETIGKRQRRGKTTGPAPLRKRIEALEATIEQAVKNRRAKKYIRELRKGYIVLKARERGV